MALRVLTDGERELLETEWWNFGLTKSEAEKILSKSNADKGNGESDIVVVAKPKTTNLSFDFMKVEEILPNVIHARFSNQYMSSMTFARLSCFYELACDDLRGRYFTLEEFMDKYAKWKGSFSFSTDWHGFNVPGDSVLRFCQIFDDEKKGRFFLEKEKKLICETMKILGEQRWKSKEFYLIGSFGPLDNSNLDNDVIEHEVAHAMYYLNKEYKETMDNLVKDWSGFGEKKKLLLDAGYHSERIVDEIQAYLSIKKAHVSLYDNSIYHFVDKVPVDFRTTLLKFTGRENEIADIEKKAKELISPKKYTYCPENNFSKRLENNNYLEDHQELTFGDENDDISEAIRLMIVLHGQWSNYSSVLGSANYREIESNVYRCLNTNNLAFIKKTLSDLYNSWRTNVDKDGNICPQINSMIEKILEINSSTLSDNNSLEEGFYFSSSNTADLLIEIFTIFSKEVKFDKDKFGFSKIYPIVLKDYNDALKSGDEKKIISMLKTIYKMWLKVSASENSKYAGINGRIAAEIEVYEKERGIKKVTSMV